MEFFNFPVLGGFLEPFLGEVLVRVPSKVGDFIQGAQVRSGIAMAVEAKGHVEGLHLVDFFHVINLAVAMDATDAAVHVGGVIEVSIVGQAMNLEPGNGLAGLGAFADQGQTGVVFENLVVAVHAGGGSGDIGIPGFFNRAVAVTTVHAHLADVDRVRKSHGLNGLIADVGVFGGEIVPDSSGEARSKEEHAKHHH